jgi:excisionase family DNA binding protein
MMAIMRAQNSKSHHPRNSGLAGSPRGGMQVGEIPPRCMTRQQAAVYCGCGSLSTFDRWVRSGKIPGPMPGTHSWDRMALDIALDRLSGLNHDSRSDPDFEQWVARHAGEDQGR